MWEQTGIKITRARMANDLSREALAARSGTSVATITRLERGIAVKSDSLARIAETVGLQPPDLRSLGHDEAAMILQARGRTRARTQTGEMNNIAVSQPEAPASKFQAVMEAQRILLMAGYEVTLVSDGSGGYNMTIRASAHEE